MSGRVLCGDCRLVLPTLEPQSVDFCLTSPPYVSSRKNQLGAPVKEDYPAWMVECMAGVWPLLKPNRSAAIVIRPNVHKGQITDYVLRTRLGMREWGWFEPDELIWIKPDGPPFGNPVRPRRSWEHILWFSNSGSPYCDAKANGKPSKRLGWPDSKWHGDWISGLSPFKDGIARCPDYVQIAVGSNAKGGSHPMAFPIPLAEWLIKLFCPADGLVLDPFAGSGSTLVAALRTERRYCGIEIDPQHHAETAKRVNEEEAKVNGTKVEGVGLQETSGQ